METYPIVIDEALAGKLTVDRQGPRTVFEADCRMLPGLVRLSVYGGGLEGYLGVLAPEGDKLRLRKTLSRTQMRGFPQEIESVERAGLAREAEPEPAKPAEPILMQTAEPPPPCEAGEAPAPAVIAAEAPPPEPEPDDCTDAGAEEHCPRTEAEEDVEELSWYSSPDGALVCFDGSENLIALPLGDTRIPADIPGQRRTVEGREYLVYRTRSGRIVR